MIKANEVAFLKTSGEAVFVLAKETPEGPTSLVKVRRPVAGQDGINHIVETFSEVELESLDEQRERFISERKRMVENYGPKDIPANPNFGLLPN